MTQSSSRKTFRERLDHMIQELRGEIMTGKRGAGEFLPSERDLVRQFRLSNKLIRIGLEQLVAEGLIHKIPRVGNQVAERTDGRPTLLRFGYHSTLDDEAGMAALLEAFHREHPNIVVQTVPLTYHLYYDTVRNYMDSGLLDVVTMNTTNFLQFQAQDSLSMFEPVETDGSIYPFLEDAFRHEGQTWVRPFLYSPLILCYNCDQLEEAGVSVPFEPASWEELIRTASRLTVENIRFGLYFFLQSKNRWPVFLLQSGVVAAQYPLPLEDTADRILEGLQACRDILYAENAFPVFLSESDALAEDLLRDGRISIIITTYFALSRLRGSNIRYDLAPLPSLREERTLLLTIGLAINRRSKVKVAAKTFADFLLSDAAQRHIGRTTLSIPAIRLDPEERPEPSPSYRPPNFDLYREIEPTFRHLSDMGLSVKLLDGIMKEARLFWAKMQDKSETRERLVRLLREPS
ncbi:extracellular solute-binding protein [Paenibacillus sp. HJGM_3]|uniref:extracellular solute-binding protein n=1 Tax=Paenibacillus sp. HJGM_3 TaxID=3379816 RepID=UPI003859A86C